MKRIGLSQVIAAALVGSIASTAVSGQAVTPQQLPATVPSLAATIAAMPKNLPRATGPELFAAIDAAKAAQQTCTAEGVKVSVLIADVMGDPVILLSGNGAGVRSALITRTKVNIVVRYGKPSGEVAALAEKDAKLKADAAADPNIGELRGGGFPVMRDGKMIGTVAVSGGTLTGKIGLDEKCAQVAVAKLEGR